MSELLPCLYQRLTPPGVGGIHVFALTGCLVDAFLDSHFRGRRRKHGDIMFGRLVDGKDVIDEVIVHRRDARIDISIHGGIAVEKRVTDLLIAKGFQPGEIPEPGRRRALAPALFQEAEALLRAANSPHSVLFFLAALEGGIAREIAGWIETLSPGEAAHEARRVGVEAAIDSLLNRAPFGLSMSMPPRIVLTGAVNAGKSTLFNALLEKERAIVTDLAGTTRDVIESPLELDGFPFLIFDTAGIRETDDEVEKQGVSRARLAQSHAHLTITICAALDLLTGAVDTPEDAGDSYGLLVASKSDQLSSEQRVQLGSKFPMALSLSAQDGTGLEELRRRIVFSSPFAGPAVREFSCPFTLRQVELLQEAQSVLPHDPDVAAKALRQLLLG